MLRSGAPSELGLGEGVKADLATGARIAAIEPVLVSFRFPPEKVQAWSGGVLPGVTAGLVRVSTGSGEYGLGEAYVGNFAPLAFAEVIRHFSDAFLGGDPGDIVRLISTARGRALYWARYGLGASALSAIEMALWDLAGKLLGKPVYELLGGAVRESIPCYASGGMETSRERLASELAGYRAEGFRAAKVRIGYSADADREKLEFCRSVVGEGFRLAADCVQGSNPRPWTAEEAIAAARPLTGLGPLWLEEPCAADDIAGYRACRDALDIPIAGGETASSLTEILSFVTAEAVDVLQPDASHLGGIIPALTAARAAADHGIDVAMHAWGGGPCVMANLHVALTASNAVWMELPRNHNPFAERLLAQPLTIRDGGVARPTTPGLGVDLPQDLIDEYPYQPGCHYQFAERRALGSPFGANSNRELSPDGP